MKGRPQLNLIIDSGHRRAQPQSQTLNLWLGPLMTQLCYRVKDGQHVEKYKKITYVDFMYENNILEEVSSYKYLKTYLHHKLNWNYNIKKKINGG
jgi:hypothetical protein